MKIPVHLKHRPVIVMEDYEQIDGLKAGNSETKGLSLGLAQWNRNGEPEISAKIWRYTGEKWSRQSEEIPLHRVIDLTIMIVQTRLHFTKKHLVSRKHLAAAAFPEIDVLKVQNQTLPIALCVESDTLQSDLPVFEKAMRKEEKLLDQRLLALERLLSETHTETSVVVRTPSAYQYRLRPGSVVVLLMFACALLLSSYLFYSRFREQGLLQEHPALTLQITPQDIAVVPGADDSVDIWIRKYEFVDSIALVYPYGYEEGTSTEVELSQSAVSGNPEIGYARIAAEVSDTYPPFGSAFHLTLSRSMGFAKPEGGLLPVELSDAELVYFEVNSDSADGKTTSSRFPYLLKVPQWRIENGQLIGLAQSSEELLQTMGQLQLLYTVLIPQVVKLHADVREILYQQQKVFTQLLVTPFQAGFETQIARVKEDYEKDLEQLEQSWQTAMGDVRIAQEVLKQEGVSRQQEIAAQKEVQQAGFGALQNTQLQQALEVEAVMEHLEAARLQLQNYQQTAGEQWAASLGDVSEVEQSVQKLQTEVSAVIESLDTLRAAVLLFQNEGLFGALHTVDPSTVDRVISIALNNPEMSQHDIGQTLRQKGLEVSDYEVFLILCVYIGNN